MYNLQICLQKDFVKDFKLLVHEFREEHKQHKEIWQNKLIHVLKEKSLSFSLTHTTYINISSHYTDSKIFSTDANN